MPDAAPTLETGTVHLGRAIRARRKTLGVSMTTAAEAAGSALIQALRTAFGSTGLDV